MGKQVKGGVGVGWFISYKTPEAFHHIMEAGKSLHCIDAKNKSLVVYGKTINKNITTKR